MIRPKPNWVTIPSYHDAGLTIILTGGSQDDGACFRSLLSAAAAHEALDAGVAAGEAMVVDQILIDGFGVAALAQGQLDEVAIRFADARRSVLAGVGGHLIGRF